MKIFPEIPYVKIPNLRLDILIRTLAGWYREKKKNIIIPIIFTPLKHIIPSNSYQLFWINISSFSVIVVALPYRAPDILWVDFCYFPFLLNRWVSNTFFISLEKIKRWITQIFSWFVEKREICFFSLPFLRIIKGKSSSNPTNSNFCCTNEEKITFCVWVFGNWIRRFSLWKMFNDFPIVESERNLSFF